MNKKTLPLADTHFFQGQKNGMLYETISNGLSQRSLVGLSFLGGYLHFGQEKIKKNYYSSSYPCILAELASSWGIEYLLRPSSLTLFVQGKDDDRIKKLSAFLTSFSFSLAQLKEAEKQVLEKRNKEQTSSLFPRMEFDEEEMKKITLTDLRNYISSLFVRGRVKALMFGNFSSEESEKVLDELSLNLKDQQQDAEAEMTGVKKSSESEEESDSEFSQVFLSLHLPYRKELLEDYPSYACYLPFAAEFFGGAYSLLALKGQKRREIISYQKEIKEGREDIVFHYSYQTFKPESLKKTIKQNINKRPLLLAVISGTRYLKKEMINSFSAIPFHPKEGLLWADEAFENEMSTEQMLQICLSIKGFKVFRFLKKARETAYSIHVIKGKNVDDRN
jgi:hypothetical protein